MKKERQVNRSRPAMAQSSLLGLAAAILLTTGSTNGATNEHVWRVQVAELPLGEAPSALATRTGMLKYRQEVSILATRGDWYQISPSSWVHRTTLTQRSLTNSSGNLNDFIEAVGIVMHRLTNGVHRPTNTFVKGAPPQNP